VAKFKQQGVRMKKDGIVVKYIRLYFSNTITKCVANAIQTSRLFLGGGSKSRTYLLADAMQSW
jgi:hypothetical protein